MQKLPLRGVFAILYIYSKNMEKFENPVDHIDEEVGKPAAVKIHKIPNQISLQLKAYNTHVAEEALKTGKTITEIVQSETEEIRKVGLAEFVKNLNNSKLS